VGLRLDLNDKVVGKKATIFGGTASGGTVLVDDSFQNTGSGFTAKERYGGPASNSAPNEGTADPIIDHRKNKCSYDLFVGLSVTTEFSGDIVHFARARESAVKCGRRPPLNRHE
jgi:hypothetical protein